MNILIPPNHKTKQPRLSKMQPIKQINSQIETYTSEFKENIRKRMLELGFEQDPRSNELMEYIYEYHRLVITVEPKKTRVKADIDSDKRCIAYRADSQQCSRRKKHGCDYCGTHEKGIPNGFILNEEKPATTTKLVVIAREIDGIVYYIDDSRNVYKTEDVMNNVENPTVIGKCMQINDTEFVEYV